MYMFITFNKLPEIVSYARIYHQTNTAVYCDNTILRHGEKGRLQMYVNWQGMLAIEMQQAEKAT